MISHSHPPHFHSSCNLLGKTVRSWCATWREPENTLARPPSRQARTLARGGLDIWAHFFTVFGDVNSAPPGDPTQLSMRWSCTLWRGNCGSETALALVRLSARAFSVLVSWTLSRRCGAAICATGTTTVSVWSVWTNTCLSHSIHWAMPPPALTPLIMLLKPRCTLAVLLPACWAHGPLWTKLDRVAVRGFNTSKQDADRGKAVTWDSIRRLSRWACWTIKIAGMLE